jgi:hypothetical protein
MIYKVYIMSDDNLNNVNLELNSDNQDSVNGENKKSLERDKLAALKMLSRKMERNEVENPDEKPIKKISLESASDGQNKVDDTNQDIQMIGTKEVLAAVIVEDKQIISKEHLEVKETLAIQSTSNIIEENVNTEKNSSGLSLPKLNLIATPPALQAIEPTTNNFEPHVEQAQNETKELEIDKNNNVLPEPPKLELPPPEENNTNLDKPPKDSPKQVNTEINSIILNKEAEPVHQEVPVSSKQSDMTITNIESNLQKPENPTGVKKLSFSAAKKEIDDFASLMDNVIVEMKEKYGVDIPDTTYDEFLPDEIKIKLIEDFFNDKEIQKLAKEH